MRKTVCAFIKSTFQPPKEVEVNKDRLRWRIHYKGREFAINLDTILKPALNTAYVEIKARTWSRSDAKQRADLNRGIVRVIGCGGGHRTETKEYAELFGI